MPNLETDLDAKIALARSSTTPTEVLNRLAYDHWKEIRQLVALKRNTSKEVLLSLSEDHEDVVRRHAIYTLAQLKKQEDLPAQLATVRSPHVSPQQLEEYANSDHKDILVMVASNPRTPSQVLESIVLNPPILELRGGSKRFTPDMYWLFVDRNEILGAIAENPSTPVHTLRKLSERQIEPDGSGERRTIGLAKNPNTPTDILEDIFKKHGWSITEEVLSAFIKNPATPYYILADSFDSPACQNNEYIQLRLRQHPNVQCNLDSFNALSAFIGGDPQISIEQIDRFAISESLLNNFKNRVRVAKYHKASESTLEKLMQEPYPSSERTPEWRVIKHSIAHNPNVSGKLLEDFVRILVSDQPVTLERRSKYSRQKFTFYKSYGSFSCADKRFYFLNEALYIIDHPKVTSKALDGLQTFCEVSIRSFDNPANTRTGKIEVNGSAWQELLWTIPQVQSAILQRRKAL